MPSVSTEIRRVPADDPAYPVLLRATPSPPALWIRGALGGGDDLACAIVGSRRPTAYGLEVAEALAAALAARGVTVVSGLARGIDTAAHRGALAAGGRTIAVLGCGIDIVYPPENGELARRIVEHGALVSQFAPGTPPLAHHFPARNRTLAALALGVVVVEAAERSGALITAALAGELGREVFAVPGRITSPASAGTHRLLKEGAMLVERWTDVVQEFPDRWRRRVSAASVVSSPPAAPAGSDEARVLALLSVDEPLHIETVIARSRLEVARAGAALIGLELAGAARQLEGQRWIAVGSRATGR